MFFPDSGQAIKNKIQQSYNFRDPPILWRKKNNIQECLKTPGIKFWINAKNKEMNVILWCKEWQMTKTST